MEIEDVAAIPKPWQDLMDDAGITSMRQLAQLAGLTSHTTANLVIIKGGTTSAENMEKIARALGVPVEELYRITTGAASRPLALPKGTERLAERHRQAAVEMIRSLVELTDLLEESRNESGIVHKKSPETAQPVQEKNGNVTPIGGRKTLTPAQRKFEAAGRRVAKIKREIPQDSPKISPDSTDTSQ